MAENTQRDSSGKKGQGLFKSIEERLRLDTIFDQGLPIKYLPYLLYVTAFGIFYIGNSHYAEKNIREISRLKQEVEDLRADFTTLKSEYMFDSKLSEVAKKAAPLGLKASMEPPYKIVKEEE